VFLIWCVGREEDVVNMTGFGVFDSSGGRTLVHGGDDGVKTMPMMVEEVGENIVLIGGGELGMKRGVEVTQDKEGVIRVLCIELLQSGGEGVGEAKAERCGVGGGVGIDVGNSANMVRRGAE